MKEIYNGETVALGGPNMVTKELVVDEATGKKAKFTYDKTTGAIAVQDEVDENSINPVTGRAVAKAIEEGGSSYTAGGGISIENDEISAKVDGDTIGINQDGELESLVESNVTTINNGFKVAKNGAGSDVTVNLVNPGSSIVLGTAKFTDFDAWDGGDDATLLTACFSFGSDWGHVVDGGTANLHIGDELDGLEIQNFAGLFYSSTPGGSQPAGPSLIPSPSWPTGTFSGGDFTVTSPYPESAVTNAVCLKLFVVFSGITPEALEARLANANWYVSNWPTTQTVASIDVTQLPSITGQAGKALMVNSGATGLEWGAAGGGSAEIVNLQGTETAATIVGYIGAGKIVRRRAGVTDTSTSKMTSVDYYLAQYFTDPWQEEVLLTAVYENAGELGIGTIKVSGSQWTTAWHALS